MLLKLVIRFKSSSYLQFTKNCLPPLQLYNTNEIAKKSLSQFPVSRARINRKVLNRYWFTSRMKTSSISESIQFPLAIYFLVIQQSTIRVVLHMKGYPFFMSRFASKFVTFFDFSARQSFLPLCFSNCILKAYLYTIIYIRSLRPYFKPIWIP